MSRIRLLPPEIVNRIAAGEVIERPASIVKELVENSIDAGATWVLVEVEDGGRRRIRVRDNGSGMAPEDLPLAFRSHATSKLPMAFGEGGDGEEREGNGHALELFNIPTLGFRGEALASIQSVAEVEAVSRMPEADCAHRYRPGPPAEGPEPVAAPAGTSIEVRNLFFNTPARRKFLRAASTELSHLVDQMARLALAFPGIRFSLASGERRLLECAATSSLRERVAALIGRERAAEFIEIREPGGEGAVGGAGSAGRVQVRGLVGPPHLHRSDARGQHFFVDGRWVRDRVLSHALAEAYRGFQIPGQKPLAYLFVEPPAGGVDVNVHPQKCEVRFLDSQSVHAAAFGAAREALERGRSAGGSEKSGAAPDSVTPDAAVLERVREAALDFFHGAPRDGGANRPFSAPGRAPGDMAASEESPRPATASPRPAAGQTAADSGGPAPRPLQLLRSYILLETEEGLVFYDQHALHEKVLYERILAQLTGGPMPRQKLLVPEVVELPVELAPLLSRAAEQLRPLGFEVEPFGPRVAAVHAVPAVLDEAPAGPVVLEAARRLLEAAGESPDEGAREGGTAAAAGSPPAGAAPAAGDPVGEELRRLAQMVACKQAVKAGQVLLPDEVLALLEEAGEASDPRFCPHGRPTRVVISRGELERRFQRR